MSPAAADSYLTKECIELRDRPHEDRPKCTGACYGGLVEISERRHQWRCFRCLRYVTHLLQPEEGSLF